MGLPLVDLSQVELFPSKASGPWGPATGGSQELAGDEQQRAVAHQLQDQPLQMLPSLPLDTSCIGAPLGRVYALQGRRDPAWILECVYSSRTALLSLHRDIKGYRSEK